MSTKVLKKAADILAPVVFFSFMFGLLGVSLHYDHASFVEPVRVQTRDIHIGDSPLKKEMFSIIDEIPPLLEAPYAEEVCEPEELSEIDHILAYIDEITSVRYPNLDPELVKAIVQRESRYDSTQVNRNSGTVGLMQVNPKWHSDRAKKLGVDDLADPYSNILVGCDLLNELVSQYPRDYALNVYAGGFDYANQYKQKISPVVSELNSIMSRFRSGDLIPGGD